eukprot:gene8939-9892_t
MSEDLESTTEVEWVSYFTDTLEEASDIVKKHELEHTLRFVTYKALKDFGNLDLYQKKHKVLWESKFIPHDGSPFFVLGEKNIACQYGKDRRTKVKKAEADKNRHEIFRSKRKYTMTEKTKKQNCPAEVVIKEIAKFTDIKSAGPCQGIDPYLAKKIVDLVQGGVSGVSEVRRHLNEVVRDEMFTGDGEALPEKSNRRFYPQLKTIKNHISKARRMQRGCLHDISFPDNANETISESEVDFVENNSDNDQECESACAEIQLRETSVETTVVSSEGTAFRDVVEDIRQMSFLLEEKPEFLKTMHADLIKVRRKMYQMAPTAQMVYDFS